MRIETYYYVVFRGGEEIRIAEERGIALKEALLKENKPEFVKINDNVYRISEIIKIQKDVQKYYN